MYVERGGERERERDKSIHLSISLSLFLFLSLYICIDSNPKSHIQDLTFGHGCGDA